MFVAAVAGDDMLGVSVEVERRAVLAASSSCDRCFSSALRPRCTAGVPISDDVADSPPLCRSRIGRPRSPGSGVQRTEPAIPQFLVRRAAMLDLKCIAQRGADINTGDQAEIGQHFARQALTRRNACHSPIVTASRPTDRTVSNCPA